MKLNQQMFAQLRAATRNLMGKGPAAATQAIQEALAGLKTGQQANFQARDTMRDINPAPGATPQAPEAPSAPQATAQELAQDFMARIAGKMGQPGFDLPGFKPPRAPVPLAIKPGAQFLSGSYRNHAGGRDYKLYIPSNYHGQAMPLLVMLHGCTQNPDDFAAGTQMNAVAEEKQCFVVYPAQAKSANNSRCWSWFNALDQQRGQGEPSIIAGIAQQIIDEYPVDEKQVYVAGLSAGGAMAVIVGTLYPDVFAAVGVHSGLPFGSAQDLPSALAAMKGGAGPARKTAGGGIPIIVFHGDRDTTVNPRNGEQVIAQGLRNQSGNAAPVDSVDSGSVPNGHRYTRTTHRHPDGTPLGEHWVIHGAGHAWSGGSDDGSYTDAKGPDASREMMRFFETVSP
ncbi:poly(hydroxyalkanoate) depolymerase family esterase [Oxalobacteraceae bacterium GrIS 1.11]